MVKVERELSLKVVRNEYDIPDKFYIGDFIKVTCLSGSCYYGNLVDIYEDYIDIFDGSDGFYIYYYDIVNIEEGSCY